MSDDYRLLTPENVELRYDVAGVGSRLLAAAIDYAAIIASYVAISIGTALIATAIAREFPRITAQNTQLMQVLGYGLWALVGLLVFFGWWGYFILFDLAWNGQSPGKRLLGLRVVLAGGQPISAAASLARNVLRVIDLALFIGVLVMLVDRASRRLGDMAAGTLVIREPRALGRAALAPVEIPAVPAARVEALPNVGRLTNAHYALVRDYFARRAQLAPDRGLLLAANLSADLARVLDVAPPNLVDSVTFLATTARAFEARHPVYDAPS